MEKTMYGILKTTGICPIMVDPGVEAAVPSAKALAKGGLPVCEVLMRNENSFTYLNNIAKEAPEVIVGAGSVINLELAKKVVDLGAKFIVMPGFNKDIVEFALKNNISVLPGCVTATEIMMALEYDVKVLKFYPIYQLGGNEMLAQLNNGPFGMVEWVVTGGLNGRNFLPLLDHPNTIAAGGDWMFNENNALIDRNSEQIALNTRNTIQDALDYKAGKLKL